MKRPNLIYSPSKKGVLPGMEPMSNQARAIFYFIIFTIFTGTFTLLYASFHTVDSIDKRIVFIVILISGIFLGSVLVRHFTNSEYRSSYELPSEIGMRQEKDTENNLKKLKEELGTQSIVFRTYAHKDYLVTLFLAYYKDIDSADKVHAPQVCYSGQGWTINSDQVIPCKVLNKNIDINLQY